MPRYGKLNESYIASWFARDEPGRPMWALAAGQPHVTVENAHHFFQEDGAPQLAQILIDTITGA